MKALLPYLGAKSAIFLSYLWPDPKINTLFQTCLSPLVQNDVKGSVL